MKKYVAIILALVMVLALAACGGTDRTELTTAYNDATNAYNEVATLANENGWSENEAVNSTLTGIAAKLEQYKAIVTGKDKITDEDMASYISDLQELIPIMDEFKPQVSVPYEADASEAPEGEAGLDLNGTAWVFQGGMNSEGVEMEQADLDAVTAEYGNLGYIFGEGLTMTAVINDQEFPGTYEVAADGSFTLTYGENPLPAVVVDLDGRAVMMVNYPNGSVYYFVQQN